MARKPEPTKRRILDLETHRDPDEPVLLQKIRGVTPNHRQYLRAIENSRITFCVGPAGTGKTYMAVGVAARLLADGVVKKILLTRPLVVCGGEELGFLPGELNDKVGPYMQPLLDAFEDFYSPRDVARLMEAKTIEMRPLALLRGSNLRDSFIICDEAQNAKYVQLHMFLTRFARGSRVVVTGDVSQTDLPHRGPNPLHEVLGRFSRDCHPDISLVKLERSDTQRDPLTAWVDERLSGDIQFRREYHSEPRLDDVRLRPDMSGCPDSDGDFTDGFGDGLEEYTKAREFLW